MYQLVRELTARQLLARQLPVIACSFAIAEIFYKFHSFTLECGAFLGTWFALDAAVQAVLPRTPRAAAEGPQAPG